MTFVRPGGGGGEGKGQGSTATAKAHNWQSRRHCSTLNKHAH
jgi:hypothetical protein